DALLVRTGVVAIVDAVAVAIRRRRGRRGLRFLVGRHPLEGREGAYLRRAEAAGDARADAGSHANRIADDVVSADHELRRRRALLERIGKGGGAVDLRTDQQLAVGDVQTERRTPRELAAEIGS